MIRALIVLVILCASVVVAEAKSYGSPKHGGVYVIAHRGAHRGIPENTLAAYEKAVELGADFVVIDLRTTKDGEFVSIHNDTVDAYVIDGTRARVRDLTLRELQSLDIGVRTAAKCHEVGAIVFVDERESTRANWQQALDWGADGIQTDDPAKLIAFLRERDPVRRKGRS